MEHGGGRNDRQKTCCGDADELRCAMRWQHEAGDFVVEAHDGATVDGDPSQLEKANAQRIERAEQQAEISPDDRLHSCSRPCVAGPLPT